MLETVFQYVETRLGAAAELAGIPIIRATAKGADRARADALLKTPGAALLIAPMEGRTAKPDEPLINLKNSFVVIACDNPEVNTAGPALMDMVVHVMKLLHGARPENGLQKIQLDSPAYENASPDSGPQAIIINFSFGTLLNTLN